VLIGHGALEHEVLGSWALDPVAIVVGTGVVAAYLLGWRPSEGRGHRAAFVAGVVALVLADVSPIHVAAEASLTWHMVQHLVIVGLAAPLIAWSTPGAALLRGIGLGATRSLTSARRRAGLSVERMRRLRHPIVRWFVFVLVFWGWHASRLYSLAVENELVHALEHATFVGASVFVWSCVVGPARASGRAEPATRVLVVFLLGLQGVLLSALMIFSPTPWYDVYAGADALGDQHLAGVLMWLPLGVLYTVTGIWAVMAWLGPDD
jgi:cytochrome c oxidase assembly factor CtaG